MSAKDIYQSFASYRAGFWGNTEAARVEKSIYSLEKLSVVWKLIAAKAKLEEAKANNHEMGF